MMQARRPSSHVVRDAPEALIIAHGFSARQLVALVRTGLATTSSERVMAGKKPMEFTRVRITDAGRRALKPSSSG